MVLTVNKAHCPENHSCPAVSACPVDALEQNGFSAPVVDRSICTGCGRCVRVCPTGALRIIPEDGSDDEKNTNVKKEPFMNRRTLFLALLLLAGASALLIRAVDLQSRNSDSESAVATIGSTTAAEKTTGTPSKQILFFMNPNGRPCQMQDAILGELKDSFAGIATVKYYRTTVPADHSAFGSYGIRGLPLLIIADRNGKELSRFTPGVQQKETILKRLRLNQQR